MCEYVCDKYEKNKKQTKNTIMRSSIYYVSIYTHKKKKKSKAEEEEEDKRP